MTSTMRCLLRTDIKQWRSAPPGMRLSGLVLFVFFVFIFSRGHSFAPDFPFIVFYIIPLKPAQIFGYVSGPWKTSQILRSAKGWMCSLTSGGDHQWQLGGNGEAGWSGGPASSPSGGGCVLLWDFPSCSQPCSWLASMLVCVTASSSTLSERADRWTSGDCQP